MKLVFTIALFIGILFMIFVCLVNSYMQNPDPNVFDEYETNDQ